MFKRLLVPVDGSDELSPRAMSTSIELAQRLGASITGFIAEPFGAHDAAAAAHASKVMARFARLSCAAGVPFASHSTQACHIDAAIVEAASEHGCDVIVMTTHAHGLLGRWLHGSCTERVAARSRLPMLVLRG